MDVWVLGNTLEVQPMGKHIKICLSGLISLPPFPPLSKNFVPHLLAEGCNNSNSWWDGKTSAVSFAAYRDLKHHKILLEEYFHMDDLASGLNSRVNDRKLCLVVFGANSAVFPFSFPQVWVYKSGTPPRFWHVLHTCGLMERRGCVVLAGVALRAKLYKNKALLISVRYKCLCASNVYFIYFWPLFHGLYHHGISVLKEDFWLCKL